EPPVGRGWACAFWRLFRPEIRPAPGNAPPGGRPANGRLSVGLPTDGWQRLRMVRRPVSSGHAGAPRRHAGRSAPVATARVEGRRLAYGRVAAASLGALVVHA